MTIKAFLSRRAVTIIAVVIAVILIAWVAAFEPVTRNYLATDEICTHCHVPQEYLHTARMSFTSIHPPAERLEKGVPERLKDRVPARCVDCHLPPGLFAATFAYTHYLSVTDLFGHFRDRQGERAGDWIPLSAARAYRVRNRLLEYDSRTCRSCHIMEEIVPESVRGQTAHNDAVESGETCIECHSNLVHRFVEVRLVETTAEEGEEDMGDEFDEFGDEFDDESEDELEGDLEEEVL